MLQQIKRPQILDLKTLTLEAILLRYTTSFSIIQKLSVCMFRIRSLLRPSLLTYTVFVKTHSIYLSMWRNLNGIKIRSQELGVLQGIFFLTTIARVYSSTLKISLKVQNDKNK